LADVPRRVLVALVKGYRLLLKAWLGNSCRFEPSCSQYALDALNRHGALAGSSLTVGRILRCHPWCEGGCDPVPDQPHRLFTRLGLVSSRPAAVSQPTGQGSVCPETPSATHQP
jgi:putative membrane protein insertion efficiency factor